MPLNEILVDSTTRLKHHARLRFDGLRARRLQGGETGEAGSVVTANPLMLLDNRAQGSSRGAWTPGGGQLKEVIPRQLYAVAIQAAIGGKIIARESVPLYEKMSPEMLRRRYHPQTKITGRNKRRKKTDGKASGKSTSSGSIYRGAQSA